MTGIISKTSKSSKATNLKSVLLQVQLQQYLPLFQRNEIDLTAFLALNEQSLRYIGIRNDTDRKILVKYIRKLQQLFLSTTTTQIENNNSMSLEIADDGLMKVSIDESNLAMLTPITEEEEEPCFSDVTGTPDDVTEGTQLSSEGNEMDESKNLQVNNDQDHDEPPTNETQPNSSSLIENSCAPIPRSRKHYSADNEDLLALRRNVVRDSNKRLSMPVESPPYYGKLPSYYDIVDRKRIKSYSYEEHEELPPYSCSVHKSGYVIKKNEFSSKGFRSKDRSWKKQYLYLWGTFLRLYKSEPIDINRVAPIREFSMQNIQIGLAKDYAKKNNVIRIRIPNGHQFLIQVQEHAECLSWIEKLQSSANISTTLDEREMPMFITLPMRRRRGGMTIPPPSTSLSSMDSVDFEGGITIINNASLPISASGLTFQQFNEMARELQQVQITEALPQQQLLW